MTLQGLSYFGGRMWLFGTMFVVMAMVSQEAMAFVMVPNTCPTSGSNAFTTSKTTAKTTTELNMGLRSFLKRKLGRNEDDNDKSNQSPESGDEDPATEASPPAMMGSTRNQNKKIPDTATSKSIKNTAATSKQQLPKTVRMGEDPTTGEIDVEGSKLGPETVQERIRRIKRGDMSAAEKEAFLKSALSTGNTPESRLPLNLSKGSAPKKVSASPFPTDSILRNMARGSKATNEDDNGNNNNTKAPPSPYSKRPATVSDAQSKKQKYLDMVTDPHRFNTYQSGGGGGLKKSSEATATDAINGDDDVEVEEGPNIPKDLGERLGVAAMETEKRNKEIRRIQAEKERQTEKQRLDREKRLAEAQRARQEEMAKREAELVMRRRSKEKEMVKNQQKSKQMEEARRAELMKAQDDYWTRKLSESKKVEQEKAARQQEEEKERQEEEQRAAKEKKKREEERLAAESEISAKSINGEDEDYDSSDESTNTVESLNDVAQARSLSSNNMINRAASQVFGQRSTLNDTPLRDPANSQKAGAVDQQLEALRSLNSPLPKPAESSTKRRTIRKSTFQPQKPVNARSQTPAQSLSDLTNTIKNPPTRGSVTPTTKPQPAQAQDRGSSLNPFSSFGKKSTSGNLDASVSNNGRAPSPPARAPSTPSSPPAKKGPIRMELPLGEDEEEAAMTEGMTIGEIMKRQNASGGGGDQAKRSKQWGVDMSRFKD